MTMPDSRFTVAFTKLWLGNHPAIPVSDAAIAAFYETLFDLDMARVIDALDELGRTHPRMPSAAEVRKLAEQHMAADREGKTRTARFTLDGDRTFDCPYCKDTAGNWVHVVPGALVNWFVDTFGEAGPFPDNWRRWLLAYDRTHQADNVSRYGSRYTPTNFTKLCCCQHPGHETVTFEAKKNRPARTYRVFNPETECVFEYPLNHAVAKFLGGTTCDVLPLPALETA